MARVSAASLRPSRNRRFGPLGAMLDLRWADVAPRRDVARVPSPATYGRRPVLTLQTRLPPAPPRTGQLLLVEDDDELRAVMAEALAADGHAVAAGRRRP
jgi:hypothetical protein